MNALMNKDVSNSGTILSLLKPNEGINYRSYQEAGISWIIQLTNLGFNCALCDEMGLGKTLQALSAI